MTGYDELIGKIHEGMDVRDPSGHKVGTVELVKPGDPEAVTTQGQEPESLSAAEASAAPAVAPVAPAGPLGTAGGPMPAPAGIFALGQIGATEPDVPPSFAERLIRTGFVKVSTKGIFKRDVYVPADQISDVEADQVFIDIENDELIKES
jgi:hypothetical protein